jgi:hypothetical protein
MNRDASVIQAAILLIIIAILGVAIVRKQQATNNAYNPEPIISTNMPASDTAPSGDTDTAVDPVDVPPTIPSQPLREVVDSDKANLVRDYFKAMGEQDFATACGLMSPAKCTPVRPTAVANFSVEYEKLINGYEYLNIQDYGIVAPSGKSVVCVKYAYRYIDDLNPQPISEILSYYVDDVDGQLKITDRVCKKKYKEGSGERQCPIQANQNFCVGLVK